MGTLPFRKALYTGITQEYFFNRRRMHTSQCLSVSKTTMDKMHARVLKAGVHKLLMCPLWDRPLSPDLTKLFWRMVEDRSMCLVDVNLNTQGQSARGVLEVDVVS